MSRSEDIRENFNQAKEGKTDGELKQPNLLNALNTLLPDTDDIKSSDGGLRIGQNNDDTGAVQSLDGESSQILSDQPNENDNNNNSDVEANLGEKTGIEQYLRGLSTKDNESTGESEPESRYNYANSLENQGNNDIVTINGVKMDTENDIVHIIDDFEPEEEIKGDKGNNSDKKNEQDTVEVKFGESEDKSKDELNNSSKDPLNQSIRFDNDFDENSITEESNSKASNELNASQVINEKDINPIDSLDFEEIPNEQIPIGEIKVISNQNTSQLSTEIESVVAKTNKEEEKQDVQPVEPMNITKVDVDNKQGKNELVVSRDIAISEPKVEIGYEQKLNEQINPEHTKNNESISKPEENTGSLLSTFQNKTVKLLGESSNDIDIVPKVENTDKPQIENETPQIVPDEPSDAPKEEENVQTHPNSPRIDIPYMETELISFGLDDTDAHIGTRPKRSSRSSSRQSSSRREVFRPTQLENPLANRKRETIPNMTAEQFRKMFEEPTPRTRKKKIVTSDSNYQAVLNKTREQETLYSKEEIVSLAEQCLKGKKMKTENPGLIADIIDELTNQRVEAMQEGNYMQSKKISETIAQIRYNFRLSDRDSFHSERVADLKSKVKQAEENLENIIKEWKKLEKDLKEKHNEEMEMLKIRHSEEVKDLQADWADPIKQIKYSKRSPDLLRSMTVEKNMALIGDFDGAHETRKRNLKQEKVESSIKFEEMENSYETARMQLVQIHEAEMEILKEEQKLTWDIFMKREEAGIEVGQKRVKATQIILDEEGNYTNFVHRKFKKPVEKVLPMTVTLNGGSDIPTSGKTRVTLGDNGKFTIFKQTPIGTPLPLPPLKVRKMKNPARTSTKKT